MSERLIYTAGVWDLLHAGHLNILWASRALGDRLVVGVLTDDGAAAYKPRPMEVERHRLERIRALPFVDAAFLQPGTDPSPVLRSLVGLGLRPAIMTHGDDWTELREGNETLAELGIGLHLLPYTPGVSSTQLRAEILGGAR